METNQIPRLKTKPKYMDAPRYKMIYQYENEFKKEFDKMTLNMIKQIGSKLKNFNEK
jgi:hypothetical protein